MASIVVVKFLILAVVFFLIAYRIRRAVLAWRQLVARSVERAQAASAGRSELPTVDLVTCSRCGDSVPRSKATLTSGGPVCRECLAVAES